MCAPICYYYCILILGDGIGIGVARSQSRCGFLSRASFAAGEVHCGCSCRGAFTAAPPAIWLGWLMFSGTRTIDSHEVPTIGWSMKLTAGQ